MDTEALSSLVADPADRPLPKLTRRAVELPGLAGKADVVVGMRRCGKTWFLWQQLGERLRSGIGWDRLLYLNLEDDRLHPLGAEELRLIPETFYQRYPASRERHCWFYFDEVQAVPGWERFVRRLLDTEEVSIILTGSSAKLLSREIATSLRGRSLATELYPFSFAEALRHAAVEIPDRWPASARTRSHLAHQLERYLRVGGFPEVQTLDEALRLRVLRDYVDVVLFRDVVERHRVDNVAALRYLQRSLLANPGGRFSVHRLYNDLKSQGIRIGKDTLHRYLSYLEDAYLLFTVSVASESLRVRQSNPRKCYPVDPALSVATSLRAFRDIGHRLETAVYLELRRRGYAASYLQTAGGYEVDFLATHPLEGRQLIQVCADLSAPATRRRELRALDAAMEELRLESATLVTLQEEEKLEAEGRRVRIVPAWRWLLEPQAPGDSLSRTLDPRR